VKENLDGIGLQETIKEDFTHKDLTEIAVSFQFRWVWSAAKGHSGGILLGSERKCWRLKIRRMGIILLA
jgi:hypothetical protein